MGVETIIGATATFLGVGTAAAAALVSIGASVVLAATSAFLTQRALKGSPALSARAVTNKGSYNPQQIVYGEALVGAGTLAYYNTGGIKNRELWAVHCLAGHECESITDVYLDQALITNAQINSGAAAGGQVTAGDYAPIRSQSVCELYKHLGTSTQAANSAMVSKFADWTSNHRLRGITYGVSMFALFDKTEQLWEKGDPQSVKWLVKGKKVYDPRLDTSPGANPDNASYIAWSDNPALCTADYLRDSKFSPLTGGIDAARIDWDSVVTSANICDALVPVPPVASPQNTQKRFTCNGVLYGSADPAENLEALLSSMVGELVLNGDKYSIHAFGYTAPATGDDLTEDDIVGAIGITRSLDSDQRINTLKATFIDPDKNYEQTDTAAISFSAYLDDRDGGRELIDTVELPLTNNNYMAQRICQFMLQEADQEESLNVPCKITAARLQAGDRANLTVTERGWTPKVYKVLGWNLFDRGGDKLGVTLNLREDDAAAYTDPTVGEYNTVNAAGGLTLGDPEPVPGIGTIPAGIQYGGGSWNCTLELNKLNDGTVNDGEVRITSGTFKLLDGSTRVLAINAHINTPWEGTIQPPDQYGYLVWGATSPDTRFGSGTYGNTTAEAAGLFPAIYDRTRDQWYAIDNDNNETAFTPASTDVAIARVIKSSVSGGIDSITSLVTYVDDPEATAGAKVGDDLLDANDAVLDRIDIENDVLVGQVLGGSVWGNPGFGLARPGGGGSFDRPDRWFKAAQFGHVARLSYADADRDIATIQALTGLAYVYSEMFPVDIFRLLEVRMYAKGSSAFGLGVRIMYSTSNPGEGFQAFDSGGAGAYADADSEIKFSHGSSDVLTSVTLSTSFAQYSRLWMPPQDAKMACLRLEVPTSGTLSLDWAYGIWGGQIQPRIAISGTSYTVDENDVGFALECQNASTTTITLPNDSDIPAGAYIPIFKQGAGNVDIKTASGVTLRHDSGNFGTAKTARLSTLYQWAYARKASDTVWDVEGGTYVP